MISVMVTIIKKKLTIYINKNKGECYYEKICLCCMWICS